MMALTISIVSNGPTVNGCKFGVLFSQFNECTCYFVSQVQRTADNDPQFGSSAVPHGQYDIQQTYARR